MTEREIIVYLRTIIGDLWKLSVTSKWNLKDAVAHMVGWTELDVASLEKIGEIQLLPWRQKGFDVDEYNSQSVEKYSKSTPDNILNVWDGLLDKRDELIETIGKESLKKDKELFYYLFEGGNAKHTLHHYQQIQESIARTTPKS